MATTRRARAPAHAPAPQHPKKTRNTRKTRKTRTTQKITGSAKVYHTHDNGGRPFKVAVRPTSITVSNKARTVLNIPSYEQVWIGANRGRYADKAEITGVGNSILVRIRGNKYIYIGDRIFEFTTPDAIKEFHGIVGRNDVIYAFAIGETNTYFFTDMRALPNSAVDFSKNPYATYYGGAERQAKKMAGRVLVGPQF